MFRGSKHSKRLHGKQPKKMIISFLDYYYDFENDTDYLKGAIFVKLFFNYNLKFRDIHEHE